MEGTEQPYSIEMEMDGPVSMKTYTKILLLFIAVSVAFSVAAWLFVSLNGQSRVPQREPYADQDFNSRITEQTRIIEDRFLFSRIRSLRDLTERTFDGAAIDTLLDRWLQSQSQVISLSADISGRARPLRVLQQGFWNDPNVLSAADNRRRRLLDFFLSNPISRRAEMEGIFTGSVLPGDILGYPVLSVGIGFPPDAPVRQVVMTLDLRDLERILSESTAESECSAIIDSSASIFFSTDPGLQIRVRRFSDGRIEDDGEYLFGVRPFEHLPWSLYSETHLEIPLRTRGTGKMSWIIFVGSGLLISLAASFILSRWIQKPLIRVARMATDIARGDFSLRVPSQKDKSVNKLAKLFNYMAEEMHHLQGLDVSEIINEKNKTETILRHIADGVVVTDPHDCVLVINRVAEQWFSVSEKQVFRKPLRDAINNKPLLDLLQDVKDGSLTSSGEFQIFIPGIRQQKIFQAHAARVQDPEDHLVGVVTVIRDVTKEKEADRIKTELVSMVAHELKSPLTSIYGFSELLLESPIEDPQTNEYARVILNESNRLTDLVNKFLDLSRIEAGRTEIRMNPFDIRHVVEKIVDTYLKQAEEKEIRVITEIPEDLSIVMGDVDMIEQVLLNLFNNAIKYSPKRSKIGIEAKEEGDQVLVSVIDNGYGIPKEALSNIFDKFYRVAETEEIAEVEGSGLGLALAKAIVELHGGTISVNSRLGVGSVFSFTVPKIDTEIH